MTAETNSKCGEIMAEILADCNEHLNDEKAWSIAFGPDWGGYSLTVYRGEQHTHVGNFCKDSTFEDLVDGLHALLVKGRGLSWA